MTATVVLPNRAAPGVAERPGETTLVPGQAPDGQHILSVVVKRTYDIGADGACQRAAEDHKLASGDQHYGDPMSSCVEYESDFVPYKPAVDVVFDGKAYAPRGEPVASLTASLRIGGVRKEVLVLGDRTCFFQPGAAPGFTDPVPFVEMEMRYDRAFGGVDVYSDPIVPCIYPRNHLGRGFAVQNVQRAVDDLALPNLEDPADLLTPERLCVGHFMYWEKLPLPCGLGWFAKVWRPRALLAGIMPADQALARELRQAYARVVPEAQRALFDQTELGAMDFRFFNGASPGLVLPRLAGGEKVELTNLVPEGRLAFTLPASRPRIGIDLGRGPSEPEVVLHTLMIWGERRQVDLVWRGAVPYDGPEVLPSLRKLQVLVD